MRFPRRKRCLRAYAWASVRILAALVTLWVSDCAVGSDFVGADFQVLWASPLTRRWRTSLRVQEGNDQTLLGFGQYKNQNYSYVKQHHQGYCKWVVQTALASSKNSPDPLLEFAKYLQPGKYPQKTGYCHKIKIDLTTYKRHVSYLSTRLYNGSNMFRVGYVNKPYLDIIGEYIDQHVKEDPEVPGVGWVTVWYRHDKLGQRLVDEGIIDGARCYAGGADPFSLPSILNEMLTDGFYLNVDDSKAHPTYMRVLTQNPNAQKVLDKFLNDAESVIQEVAQHYFYCLNNDVIKKVKQLFLRLGMDGKVATWREDHGVEETVSEHPIVSEYAAVMPAVTEEFKMLPEGQRAIELIKREFPERKRPERTWKSFLLQEIEFVSYRAKATIAKKYDGHGSIEHDGIKLFRGEKLQYVDESVLEKELSDAVTEQVREFVQRKYNRTDPCCKLKLHVKVKAASFDH